MYAYQGKEQACAISASDPARPTAVIACPQTCRSLQDRAAAVRVDFGCRTKLAPIC